MDCERRARILYGGTYYRCRHCYRLVYESQYERFQAKGLAQAQKVRNRLGGSMAMMDAFPPKPKGMHWKTYWRLEEADLAAQMSIDRALMDFTIKDGK